MSPAVTADPRPGQYGCVKTRGIIAWLIRLATRSWCNHVFVVIGGGRIIEAEPGGARVADLSEYAGCRVSFNDGDRMTAGQRNRIVTAAVGMIGDEYNYLAFGADALASLGWTWRWLFKLARQDHKVMLCSQMAARCGLEGRMDWLCGHRAAVYVTPADLAARPQMGPVRTLPADYVAPLVGET